MSFVFLLLGLALLSWLVVVAVLTLTQRRFLYRPAQAPHDPRAAGVPALRPIDQAGTVLGWWMPPPNPTRPVLVFFHGNRGTLARAAGKALPWAKTHGLGLFCATWRGYEGNPGRPCEDGLYQDARRALRWLADQGWPAPRLIHYGESLGAAVALQMALEEPPAALVLEAPFASIAAMARRRYPFAPGFLIRDRFDNLKKIPLCRCPLLILHGEADRTTLVAQGRKLAAAAPPGTITAFLPAAGHLDLYDHGAEAALKAFLAPLTGV